MSSALLALALIQAPASAQQSLPDSTRVAINRVFATWSATDSMTAEQLAPVAGMYLHPVTGGPLFATLRRDTLVLGRINGPALLPIAENRFQYANQPSEAEFRSDGSLVQIPKNWPPRAPTVWKRVASAPSQPAHAELEKYAGSYYCEELGASYQVSATDSTLVLKTRWATDRTFHPVAGDLFQGDYLIRFTRARGGKVDGMLMSSGRVFGVRFDRTQPK